MTAITRNLPQKTGKTLDEWIALVRVEGPAVQKERVAWLKKQHGLGHSTASIIAGEAAKPEDYVEPSAEELVDRQYSGAKAALRPIYERVIEAVGTLGPEATMEPRQTYVSFNRRRQFALVQASTKDRVDLALALPNPPESARLQPATSLGSERTNGRVALTSPDEVDAAVLDLLRLAYAEDAPSR